MDEICLGTEDTFVRNLLYMVVDDLEGVCPWGCLAFSQGQFFGCLALESVLPAGAPKLFVTSELVLPSFLLIFA